MNAIRHAHGQLFESAPSDQQRQSSKSWFTSASWHAARSNKVSTGSKEPEPHSAWGNVSLFVWGPAAIANATAQRCDPSKKGWERSAIRAWLRNLEPKAFSSSFLARLNATSACLDSLEALAILTRVLRFCNRAPAFLLVPLSSAMCEPHCARKVTFSQTPNLFRHMHGTAIW